MNALHASQTERTDENADLAAVSDVEAGIRDFVRNDIAYLRRPTPSMVPPPVPEQDDADVAVSNVNTLIQRVAGASLNEIENLIAELEELRDLMHNEGERVQRELQGYAQLSHAAMKSSRVIADNLAQWKRATPLTD
jgi:hypothetical protein